MILRSVLPIFTVFMILNHTVGAEIDKCYIPKDLPLESVVYIGDKTVPPKASLTLRLPPLPSKRGKIIVLCFNAYAYTKVRSGCNFNLELYVNEVPITRRLANGDERLIGRKPIFHISHLYTTKYEGVDFPIFSGKMIRLMFAPNVESANRLSEEGQGAFFALNISDLVRGVDGNTLTLKNIRRGKGKSNILVFKDICIGWLDKRYLPKPINKIPKRSPIKNGCSLDGLSVLQGIAGGFVVKMCDGKELFAETAISMNPKARSVLIASDKPIQGINSNNCAKVEIKQWANSGYVVIARNSNFTLERTIRIVNREEIEWHEHWVNMTNSICALPFRYRFFLGNEVARFTLAGDPECDKINGCAGNPTMFIEFRSDRGRGFGITLESDKLRLLARMRANGGVGEIYTADLALAPHGSIDFSITITPITKGGYWEFINKIRRRWGVNAGSVDYPIYWRIAWARGKNIKEVIKKSLGHIGHAAVWLWGGGFLRSWVGLDYDSDVIIHEKYPLLAKSASRGRGKSPNLDIDAYLTFAHRKPYWEQFKKLASIVHDTCPKVKVLMGMHPAIQAVYLPELRRWIYAQDVIRTKTGEPFQDSYYSQAFLSKDAVKKDWAALYFLPRKNSVYLDYILQLVRYGLDKCGADGFYIDEFSWAGSNRFYSRYSYNYWDGYSADIDGKGHIVALKTDNAYVTKYAQLALIKELTKRKAVFLGNGTAALRCINDMHVPMFVEGGNGVGAWRSSHLATVPMIYGNFGESRREMTLENLLKDVRSVIQEGCLYSPTTCNLVLDGPDNFISKLYPISILSIGPGIIKGKQRLITIRSGRFEFSHSKARNSRIVLYVYDKSGRLMHRGHLPTIKPDASGFVKIVVPKNGLVIAEVEKGGKITN